MRLDEAVLGLGVCRSRSNARRLIIEGRVKVDGITVTKPGTEYRGGLIDVRADRYVSRAGEKLEAALERFKIDPAGKYVVDFGASTGGFTDCLLAHGAEYVWAVDVGTAQLAPKLRDDPRVKVLEKTDGRNVTPVLLGRIADMAVMDVSFNFTIAALSRGSFRIALRRMPGHAHKASV